MTTRRALKEVDRFTHRESGVTVIIYLTPGNVFTTNEIFGERLVNSAAKDLHWEANKYLDENHSLEFFPVIEVSTLEPFGAKANSQTSAFVGINTMRLYYAKNLSGKFFQIEWDYAKRNGTVGSNARSWSPNNWRNEHAGREFVPPIHLGDTWYLPYTDDVWDGLMHLLQTITIAKDRLQSLFGSEDGGVGRLTAAGGIAALLGDGK